MPDFPKMLLATCYGGVFGGVFVGEVEAHFMLTPPLPPGVCSEKSPFLLEAQVLATGQPFQSPSLLLRASL